MNENSILPPENVIEAANKGLKYINRYSDVYNINKLKELIGVYNNISTDRIIVGAGADPLIRETIHLFSNNRKVIMANPSFFPSIQFIKQYSNKLIKVQLTPPEFKINHNIIMDEINQPTLIIIDSPNNPTGNILLEKSQLKEILGNENVLVLVDEAYYEFCKYTFLDLIYDYPNLAIVRSMDKAFSLAGLRIGYLIAGDFFRSKFSDFQTSLSQPALYAAIEALKNFDYVKQNVLKTIKERERLTIELEKLGFIVYPSNANFLLVKSKNFDLAMELRNYDILIADLSDIWLEGFYRISIGTYEENSDFLVAINKILNTNK